MRQPVDKTLSGQLLDIVERLLVDGTSAGGAVYRAREWPLTIAKLPALLINSVYVEERESTGNAAPEFHTITTFVVEGRVSAPSSVDDQGSSAINVALERLKREIETTLINAYPLMLEIENFPRISTKFEITPDAKTPLGKVEMTISMRFLEGPECFVDTLDDTDPLEEISVSTDLLNVFDPNGTYVDTLFPQSIPPAPRTSGPDGRIEGGGLHFTNLQD